MPAGPVSESPGECAVVVSVPEAEAAVSALRARLDPAAAWGVPAHVTVLYPFLPPEQVGPDVLAMVGQAVATVPRFVVTLQVARWFDESVLWLAPEPAEPFGALTAAVCRRFPETSPYGGAHTDPVPHLTVGTGGPVELLRPAAADIRASLPIRAYVDRVQVMCGSPTPNSWHTIAELQLGPLQRDVLGPP